MDTRKQVRVPADGITAVTVLGEPDIRLDGRVKDVSRQGMGIEVARKVPPGSAIKIETADDLFLGEVVHCRAVDDGWFLGIRISQVLSGLAALGSMVREFEAFLHPAGRTPVAR